MTKVYTNYHKRPWRRWWELLDKEQEQVEDDHDYLFDSTEGDNEYEHVSYIVYRGHVYVSNEFCKVPDSAPEWLKKWHWYLNDSFFSGIVIREVEEDGEWYIQIGTFY